MITLRVDPFILARTYVGLLPKRSVWSFTITNEDDGTSPAALNIYCPESEWQSLCSLLNLEQPSDTFTEEPGPKFLSFKKDALCVSFIDMETA